MDRRKRRFFIGPQPLLLMQMLLVLWKASRRSVFVGSPSQGGEGHSVSQVRGAYVCPPCAGCRGGGDAKPAWCPENAVWRWVWVGLAHKDRRATMWELNTGLWVKGGPGRIRSPWRRLLLKSVSQGDPQMDRDVGSYRSPFWTEGRNIFSFFSLRSLFSHCTKKEESIIYVWQEN